MCGTNIASGPLLALTVHMQGREAPVLYSELFYNFAGRQLLTTTEPTSGAVLTFPERNRTNWDNMSGGLDFIPSQEELDSNTFGPYSSAEACVGMCTSQPDCLQWKWRPGKCKLGKLPNLGRRPFAYWDPGNGDNTEELMSGWIEERIREYVKKLGECDLGKAFSA